MCYPHALGHSFLKCRHDMVSQTRASVSGTSQQLYLAAVDVMLTALSARKRAVLASGKAVQTLKALTDFAFRGAAAATMPMEQLATTHAGSLRFCAQMLRCHECAHSCMVQTRPTFGIGLLTPTCCIS